MVEILKVSGNFPDKLLLDTSGKYRRCLIEGQKMSTFVHIGGDIWCEILK
jgi:hypothetical protein